VNELDESAQHGTIGSPNRRLQKRGGHPMADVRVYTGSAVW
jgi:hypothetical protein